MSNGDTPFFQTRMGDKFYNGTMPALVKALERIADALEKTPAAPPLDLEGITRCMCHGCTCGVHYAHKEDRS